MDLNQLYLEHQHLLVKARRAAEDERSVHERAASHIAARIGCLQTALGAPAAHNWVALAATGTSQAYGPMHLTAGCTL